MTYRNRDKDHSPYEEEYRGFDIRDDDSSRGPLILTLAIGVLIVFAAVVWNTYRQGVRPQDGALPMVVAETQPYKRVPDDRGGVEIEDLDRRLYDVMDGSKRKPEPTKVASPADQSLQGGPPMDLRPSSSEDTADQTPVPESFEEGTGMEVTADVSSVQQAGDEPVESEASDLADDPASTPQESAPDMSGQAEATENVAKASPGFGFVSGGEFFVQISALRSEEAAGQAWEKVRAANPSLFSGASKSVERADLGAKGVFYRLRAGAFGKRDDASQFCDAYKAKGGDCIVVRGAA
ncbi:SPOR domain-containing protein [Henriciella sp.]|uniref:SPOR domain-containing protein n=1 Tax=Henriciella sp. TaxID=1968823 RepID=UPI00260AEE52|nr:SPOR domain-containing protein [Henriciella sp.]